MVHTWDMRMRRCLSRAVDEGCFCSTSLAASADGRLYATGSKAGVVNVYNRSHGCCPPSSLGVPASLDLLP